MGWNLSEKIKTVYAFNIYWTCQLLEMRQGGKHRKGVSALRLLILQWFAVRYSGSHREEMRGETTLGWNRCEEISMTTSQQDKQPLSSLEWGRGEATRGFSEPWEAWSDY